MNAHRSMSRLPALVALVAALLAAPGPASAFVLDGAGEPTHAPPQTGFFFSGSLGLGGGYFAYLDVPDAYGRFAESGPSPALSAFAGTHSDRFALGFGGIALPLLYDAGGATRFAPGGFVGVELALRDARVQLDLILGFGGVGIPWKFGGVGPYLAPGLSYLIALGRHVHLTVGARLACGLLVEPERGVVAGHLAPNASVGLTYW